MSTDIDFETVIEAAAKEYGPSLTKNGSGSTRIVFRVSPEMVLKIPRWPKAVSYNENEAKLARGEGKFPAEYCAPCELVDFMGVDCLLMEAVMPIDWADRHLRPTWANEMDDGAQVGIHKDGRILAYDYGSQA